MSQVYGPGTRPVVVVTRRLPPVVEAALRERFDVELNQDDHPFGSEELRGALRRADALVPTVTDRLDASVLSGTPRAGLLANYGAGTDHIDLDAARSAGLAVSNTPGVLTDAVADLTLALILMACRRAGEGEREVRAGRWTGWRPTHLLGREVSRLTLGIVGMGRIGRAVATRARLGFGMTIVCTSRRPVEPEMLDGLAAVQLPLDTLLGRADVVTLHVPATPDTKHLLNAERLARMKPGAVLVNTTRGSVVDEPALAEALRSGRLGAAALDVYEAEPEVHPDLLSMENVVLLPHLGSATVEARTAMGLRAVANLDAFFAGKALPDAVLPGALRHRG